MQLCDAVTSTWTEINGAAAVSQRQNRSFTAPPPNPNQRSPSASRLRTPRPFTPRGSSGHLACPKWLCEEAPRSFRQTAPDGHGRDKRSDAHWTSFRPFLCESQRDLSPGSSQETLLLSCGGKKISRAACLAQQGKKNPKHHQTQLNEPSSSL